MDNKEILDKFKQHLQLKRSKQTANQYYFTMQQFLEEYFQKPYSEIDLDSIDGYFIWLQNSSKRRADKNKTGQGIARLTKTPGKLEPSTINKYLSTIKRFLKFVGNHDLADKIEFAKTQKWRPQTIDLTALKKLLTNENYLRQIVEDAWTNKKIGKNPEIKKFLIDRNVLLFKTVFVLGVRIGEAQGLKRDSFSFDLRQPVVRVTGKTGTRTIPLDKNTVDSIEFYLKQNPIKDYLFCSFNGGVLGVSTLENYIKMIFVQAGLNLHTHSLRHGFATTLIDAGYPIEIVSELLGHSSLDMTKRYIDTIKGRVMKPCNPIDELLKGKEN